MIPGYAVMICCEYLLVFRLQVCYGEFITKTQGTQSVLFLCSNMLQGTVNFKLHTLIFFKASNYHHVDLGLERKPKANVVRSVAQMKTPLAPGFLLATILLNVPNGALWQLCLKLGKNLILQRLHRVHLLRQSHAWPRMLGIC